MVKAGILGSFLLWWYSECFLWLLKFCARVRGQICSLCKIFKGLFRMYCILLRIRWMDHFHLHRQEQAE